MSRKSRFHQSGMALPMVLWSIALLTGIVLLLAGIIEGWITEETHSGKLFQARQQALSGVAIAMNPGVLPGDPLLNKLSKDGSDGYQVVIKDESGLINPNAWLTPDHRDLFGRLFTAWGLDKNTSDTAADGLFDWQSPSPFRSLHGAKKEEYKAAGLSGLPPGAPFVSPEEMSLVIGFDPVMQAKPDWISYFTTYTPAGAGINILYAPKNILTDFLGLTPSQADNWINQRNGPDGVEGTADDFNGKVPSDLESALKLWPGILPPNLRSIEGDSPSNFSILKSSPAKNSPQNLNPLLTVASWGSLRRIEGTGFCNGMKCKITVTVPTGGSVLGWSEK